MTPPEPTILPAVSTDRIARHDEPVTTPAPFGSHDSPAAQPAAVEDAWGILTTWVNASDEPEAVDPADVERLREVIGLPPDDLEARAPIVTRPGCRIDVGTIDVRCEDGSTRSFTDVVPTDFPLGYHSFPDVDGGRRRLIVSPGRCWLPEDWRAWGWTVQLYATMSRGSWGIGDLRDLGALRDWSRSAGAGFLLVNPMHAVAPTFPQEASPYLPTSRRYRNPIYLSVEDVDGFDPDVAAMTAGHRAEIADLDEIDRDRVWQTKRQALRQIFDATSLRDEEFVGWQVRQGESLEQFSRWMTIALEHGGDWRTWPVDLRDPYSEAVRTYADEHADEVEFQAWLQWLMDRQLVAATMGQTVLQDLPIGVDGGGADAWSWQGVLATGCSVGAPPDLFNSFGQDWGSPPFVPWRLRAHDYVPFIESIRATMAHAGGLRIDHVMGLFRLWWIPGGAGPADGAYVRYPYDDLLDIVALESHREQAIVVGEDLGTVEDGVREALAERQILSYRLLYFEPDGPETWPRSAMAAITTHDLPTLAGLWTGADAVEAARCTQETPDVLERHRAELLRPLGVTPEEASTQDVDDAIVAAHRLLAEAPSVLLSATLEDAIGGEVRPNIPGSRGRANWCVRLPVWIDDLSRHRLVGRVADALAEGLSVRADQVSDADQPNG
jgi:4-alpha-glucanotransferase